MASKNYLAIDLGASGGRCLIGNHDGERIELREIHHFENGGVEQEGRLVWDVKKIWNQILAGLGKVAAEEISLESLGVDTWGVDFGLLDDNKELLANPLHYRDQHTRNILPQAFEVMSRNAIFAESGLQFMELNSLFQLFAMVRDNNEALRKASTFLMMPDLFHWMLCGEISNEMTNASTTQIYNPGLRIWSKKIIDAFELPGIFQDLSEPGTCLGKLKTEILKSSGLKSAKVVLPATHDTASAVLAVPASGFAMKEPDWCYISSGTWSLMGVELAQPRLDELVCQLNFTNEAGVGGTTRLLKNISGLWLLQQCQKEWRGKGQVYDWAELVALAENEQPRRTIIDADDPGFVAPASMVQAIAEYCRLHSQPLPQTVGQFVRCCLESLAEKYRQTFEHLCEIMGYRLSTIHIVGGGSQNALLCQLTADACQVSVLTGPVEATAIGNILAQLIADGSVESFDEARQLVRNSFSIQCYWPK